MDHEKATDADRRTGEEYQDLPAWTSKINFPTTGETLINEYGDEELNLENGETKPLREILAPYAHESFNTMQDVIIALKGGQIGLGISERQQKIDD